MLILFLAVSITISKAQFEYQIALEPIPSKNCYNQKLVIRFEDATSTPDEEYILYKILPNNQKEILGKSKADSIVFFPKTSGYITVHNANSSKKSAEIILNVQSYQDAFLSFDKEAVCAGFARNIEIYTGVLSTDTIKWYKNGSLQSALTSSKISVFEPGVYSATITRDLCTYDVNNSANIKIGEISQAEVNSENYPSVCEGFSVKLKSTLPNISGVNMQWLKDGQLIPEATTKEYDASTSGLYQLQLKQGTCTSTSGNFEVKVGELYTTPIAVSPFNQQNNEVVVCEGLDFNLSLRDYSSRKDVQVKWYRDNELVSEETVFNTVSDGNYRYQLSQGDCKVISPTLKVTYGEMPVLSIEGLQGFKACNGQSVGAFVRSSNSSLINLVYGLKLFKNGDFLQNISSPFDLSAINSSGSYQVKGSFSDPSCIVKSAETSFSFENAPIAFDLNSGNPAIYSCAAYTTLAENLTLPGSNDLKSTYTWTRNNQVIQNGSERKLIARTDGNYTLEVKTSDGCSFKSSPITLKLNHLDVGIQNANTYLCQGLSNYLLPLMENEDIINVDENGIPYAFNDLKYTWFKENEQVGTASRLFINKTGTYSLKSSIGSCVSQSFPFDAVLTDIDTRFDLTSDSVAVCEFGGEAKLTLKETDATYYTWIHDEEILSFNGYDLRVENTGKYQAIIEKNGCFDQSDTITVFPNNELPTATISGNQVFFKGDIVEAQIEFSGAGPWTFELSDGFSEETYENPYTYSLSPSQNVVLTVENIYSPCGFGEGLGSANFTEKLLSLEFEPSILVYPNPSTDIVHIQTTKPILAELFSVNGQKIKSVQIQKEKNLDIKNLAAGKYQLRFIDLENAATSSFDLIKK